MRYLLILLLIMPPLALAEPKDDFSTELSIGSSYAYYEDTDDNVRDEVSLFSVAQNKKERLGLHAEVFFTDNPQTSEDLSVVDVRYLHGMDTDLQTMLEGGIALYSNDEEPVAAAGLTWSNAEQRLSLLLERAPLTDTTQILQNKILYYGIEGDIRSKLSAHFTPRLALWARDYSDSNSSLRLRLDLPYEIKLREITFAAGYRQEYAAFRRQSGGGYFDPNELHLFLGVLSASYWTPDVAFYSEVFSGKQHNRRYANSERDTVIGTYSELTLQQLLPVDLSFIVEGGDYSLGAASGFRYWYFGAVASVPFH